MNQSEQDRVASLVVEMDQLIERIILKARIKAANRYAIVVPDWQERRNKRSLAVLAVIEKEEYEMRRPTIDRLRASGKTVFVSIQQI